MPPVQQTAEIDVLLEIARNTRKLLDVIGGQAGNSGNGGSGQQQVIQYNTNDSTQSQTVKTLPDGTQAVTTAPTLIASVPQGVQINVSDPILKNHTQNGTFVVPINGTVNVVVALSVSTEFSIAHNASNASSSQYNNLNAGSALAAGAEYAFSIPVGQGETIDFQVSAQTKMNLFKLYFIETQ